MRKKKSVVIGAGVGILVIVFVFIGHFWMYQRHMSRDSEFTRNVEEDRYSLGCKILNTTLIETYSLKEGDIITVAIDVIKGEFTICIGIKGEEPVYTGNGITCGDFQVNIPKTGDYEISVTGKKAEGSVSFTINR